MRFVHLAVLALLSACPRSAPPPAGAPDTSVETKKAVVAKTEVIPKKDAARMNLAKISTTPRMKRKAENETSPLGTNLIAPSFVTSEWAFVDSVKTAGWWTSATVDKWGDGRSIDTDEDGWPKKLEPGQRAVVIIAAQEGGPMILDYEGKGSVEIGGTTAPVDNLKASPGRMTFRAKMLQHLILTIAATNPKDPVRNVRVYSAKHEAAVKAGAVFHPTFLDRMAPFKVIRFMDWQHTNSSPIKEWKDRSSPTLFSQAMGSGVSYEHMVLLANTLHADPWFNIPHEASDDFVVKFATFLKEELDPGRTLYLEYSNEFWHDHPEFSQALYGRQMGEKLKLHQDNGIARLQFQAKRSTHVMKIFAEVFGTKRLVRVLGSQLGNFYAHDGLMVEAETRKHHDAVAIAAYFGHEVGTHDKLLAKNDVEEVVRFLEEHSVPWTIGAIKLSTDWGKKNGFDILAYEGGQHIVANPSRQNDERIGKLLDAANADPRIGKMYTRMLEGWKANGGHVFVHFTFAGIPEKYGRFGALEYAGQPLEEAVKHRALLEFIEKHPRWWQ